MSSIDNKFVIVSPSYNNEEWTDVYYESIDCQTYKNYQVVYIDDCSTDNTQEAITSLSKNNSEFTYIRNETNRGAFFNYIHTFETCTDDDNVIFVNLDGDDWLATPEVLEKLNEEYNNHDYWLTYGKMMVYNGTDQLTEAFPQNSAYDPFVHKYSLYRRDSWRSSHLRTFRKFLFDKIRRDEFVSKIDGKLFWHASDLAFMYPMLEMSPPNKIGVMEFPTYVYNNSKTNAIRTREREDGDNVKFETEIRRRSKYKRSTGREDLSGEVLPLINVYGDYMERHSILTRASYVYGPDPIQKHDITTFQDENVLKYLSGEVVVPCGKKIAQLIENPHLGRQKEVYEAVKQNADKFDLILTWREDLLKLPNAKFFTSMEISQWNLLPEELNESWFQIYPKSKSLSFIASGKSFSPGHQFRSECFNFMRQHNAADFYGRDSNPIKSKLEGLKDYRFSIAMENSSWNGYYTEKILDCFLAGTVPIYYGCKDIADHFDINGILTFTTLDELVDIVNSLDDNLYASKLESVNRNFELASDVWLNNDRYFDKYLKPLLA
jgi:glycosyltransferase involved in cell wall biosynthesis